MALYFGAATGNKMAIGTGAAFTDLTLATVLAWVRPTVWVPTRENNVIAKGDFADGYWRPCFFSKNASVQGILGTFCRRGTTTLQTEAHAWTNVTPAADKWLFVATGYDFTLTDADQWMMLGELTVPAEEPSAYDIRRTGSGNYVLTNAGRTAYVGNSDNASQVESFVGDIACLAVYNIRMTPAAARTYQYRPYLWPAHPNCIGYWQLGLIAAASAQPDWSRGTNDGTVTGATVSDHVPLGPLFSFDTALPMIPTPRLVNTSWSGVWQRV